VNVNSYETIAHNILIDKHEMSEGEEMYKNKALNGAHNLCGEKLRELRLQTKPRLSQRALAEKLQLSGLDLDKNAIQRIEAGKRFVTDIELNIFASYFGVTTDELLR